MPGFGGPDYGADTNDTVDSNNVTSALTSFAINLGGALATIGITKLANANGQSTIATGIATNPVQVIPAGQFGNTLASSVSSFAPILLFGGVLLLGVFGIAALRK